MFNLRLSATTETTIKSTLVLAAVMAVIGTLGSFVAGSMGVYFGLAFTFCISFATMWYSREIAIWLTGGREIKADEHPEGFDLVKMVDSLRHEEAINLKVMPKIYIIDSNTKNAFATGRHQGHSAIAVTKGLLQGALKYADSDRDKANRLVEAILIHELGHIVNNDIAVKTAASIMVGSIRILSEYLYNQRRSTRQSFDSKNQNSKGSVFFLIAEYLIFNLVIPYIGILLGLCLSRTRECAADDMTAKCGRAQDMAEALSMLREVKDPKKVHSPQMEALSNMMCASLTPERDQQIADNLNSPNTGRLKAFALYISNAFSTHPPLNARIERLQNQENDKIKTVLT